MTDSNPDPRYRELMTKLAETALLQAEPVVTVRLPFDLHGRLGFSEGAIDLLNASNRIFRIEAPAPEGEYVLVVGHPAGSEEDALDQRQLERLAHKAFQYGRLFLAALSSASKALLVWRTMATIHRVQASVIGDGRPLSLATTLVNVEPRDLVTEFSLHHALKTIAQVRAQVWSEVFLTNYENGAAFLLGLKVAATHLPEAYLSYFRCLEYLVKVKILGASGQMQPSDICDAFRRLGPTANGEPVPRDLVRKMATDLVRRRGQCAAHHLRGFKDDLTPQEIYKVKELVDFFFAIAVDKKLGMEGEAG